MSCNDTLEWGDVDGREGMGLLPELQAIIKTSLSRILESLDSLTQVIL